MPTPQSPQSDSSDDLDAVDERNPMPDEDGPHDVPDDAVIEKTLPARGSLDMHGKAG